MKVQINLGCSEDTTLETIQHVERSACNYKCALEQADQKTRQP